MAQVQVQPEFRHRIQKRRELADGVEAAGQGFNHQSHPAIVRERSKIAQTLEIAFVDEVSGLQRSVAVRMEVHPTGTELGKNFETLLEFLHGGAADGFEGAA